MENSDIPEPLPEFEFVPDGDAMTAALRAARRTGGRAAIEVRCRGLIFRAAISGNAASLVLTRGDIQGPYCSACRKSLSPTSYTEWSTSERVGNSLANSCGSCGQTNDLEGCSTIDLIESIRLQLVARLGTRHSASTSPTLRAPGADEILP